MSNLKRNVITFIVAAAGMAAIYIGFHLYNDHLNHHALVDMVVNQQRVAQAQSQPSSAPAPSPTK